MVELDAFCLIIASALLLFSLVVLFILCRHARRKKQFPFWCRLIFAAVITVFVYTTECANFVLDVRRGLPYWLHSEAYMLFDC